MEQQESREFDNHLAATIENADLEAPLDEHAKELLADKTILSELIKRLIPEFHDIPTQEIRNYINGTPYIGTIRVHPGETTKSFAEADAVRSLGQESRIPHEGLATFDILFQLMLPDSEETIVEVYIDLEAQNNEELPYALESRAVYYLARLLSSQYQRDFKHSEYNRLRKVYSIWVVMDPSAENADTISSIAYQQTALLGQPKDNKGYDLSQAFLVRLQKDPKKKSEDRLVNLLSMIFLSNLTPAEKKAELENSYGIPVTEEMERMVDNMCNYSSYVLNKGFNQGMQQGMQQGKATERLNNIKELMKNLNLSPIQAMDALGIPADDRKNYFSGLQQYDLPERTLR